MRDPEGIFLKYVMILVTVSILLTIPLKMYKEENRVNIGEIDRELFEELNKENNIVKKTGLDNVEIDEQGKIVYITDTNIGESYRVVDNGVTKSGFTEVLDKYDQGKSNQNFILSMVVVNMVISILSAETFVEINKKKRGV